MTAPEANEGEVRKDDALKQEERIEIPDILPVLPLPDAVAFPYTIVPLLVSSEKGINAVDQALTQNRMVLLMTQRDQAADAPSSKDMYDIGTVAAVIRMLKLPEQKVRILVQGIARASVQSWEDQLPYIQAHIMVLEETVREITGVRLEALMRNVIASLEKAAALGKNISQEAMIIAANLDHPGRLADLVAGNLSLKLEESQEILSIFDPSLRLQRIHELLTREVELLTVQQQITTQAKDGIDKGQKEYFLRQQMKAIQSELGEGNEFAEEVRNFVKRADSANLTKEAREEFDRQIHRFERMAPDMAETATVRTYLDWMVGLPWSVQTNDNLDLKKARKILNDDHYGLDKIKIRIIEHLAVRKLKQDSKGPILCFVGPPGTGKTSLGKSIARALGRSFVRLSLGGVHDEAEIRGHRRTYVGAMPGRIIQGISQAKTNNPVFMMDEVDKLGADFRGDPSSALLEVLDPEQNNSFRDNYLGVPFDLSNVLFITTANMMDTIHPAFRDRMEVISLSGYTEEEKVQIATRHIVPKQIKAHGLTDNDVVIGDDALRAIIRGYTREAGLRNLERGIATVCRKAAMRFAMGKRKPVVPTAATIHSYLGPSKNMPDNASRAIRLGLPQDLRGLPSAEKSFLWKRRR